MSILAVPSNLPEVLALGGRVVVLEEACITGAFWRADATCDRVMLVAAG
jgi:ABC-type sugar transport system ATPase subunit